MRRRSRIIHTCGACVAVVLMATFVVATPADAASIWTVEKTFNPQSEQDNNSFFDGVSASEPDDAWAVGAFQAESTGEFTGLAEHWKGSEWAPAPIQEPAGEQAQLMAVDDLGSSNAWAVGIRYPSGIEANPGFTSRTLIEHWNGSRWMIVPSPNSATGKEDSDTLSAIAGSGPDDLWAVGNAYNQQTATIELLFEHYNGVEWSLSRTPTQAGQIQSAYGVAATSSQNVWAVGTQTTTESVETLAAHWNGTQWSLVRTPDYTEAGVNVENMLTGVSAVNSGDVWASGYAYNVKAPLSYVPYVLKWNGTSWQLSTVPNSSGGSRLLAITALSASDVWAVGSGLQSGAFTTLTEKFNGSKWSVVASPDPGGGSLDELFGVTSAGTGDLFTAGTEDIEGECCDRTLALGTTSG